MAKSPPPAAIEEAARNPGGWVYEIGQGIDLKGHIPPAAIVGYWKVDEAGKIVGEFVPNPKHDEHRYPAPRPDRS